MLGSPPWKPICSQILATGIMVTGIMAIACGAREPTEVPNASAKTESEMKPYAEVKQSRFCEDGVFHQD